MIIQLETQRNYILVIFENLNLTTNLTGNTYLFFKKAVFLIEQINLLKGAFKKIRSLHCEALKFAVVTEASPLGTEFRKNNSSITRVLSRSGSSPIRHRV